MVQNASCKSVQNILKPTVMGRCIWIYIENLPVTDLSKLLAEETSLEKRREVVEYIREHTEEFEEVLENAFSGKPRLKRPLLNLVDLLNGNQLVLLVEKAVRDDDTQIENRVFRLHIGPELTP